VGAKDAGCPAMSGTVLHKEMSHIPNNFVNVPPAIHAGEKHAYNYPNLEPSSDFYINTANYFLFCL
jgi:hypothetical protein